MASMELKGGRGAGRGAQQVAPGKWAIPIWVPEAYAAKLEAVLRPRVDEAVSWDPQSDAELRDARARLKAIEARLNEDAKRELWLDRVPVGTRVARKAYFAWLHCSPDARSHGWIVDHWSGLTAAWQDGVGRGERQDPPELEQHPAAQFAFQEWQRTSRQHEALERAQVDDDIKSLRPIRGLRARDRA